MIFTIFQEFDVRFAKYLIFLAFFALPIYSLFAAPFAALELCVFSDGQDFQLSTKDSDEAEKQGFQKFKETETFMRVFQILVDGAENNSFRPLDKKKNCVRSDKIQPGKHTVSINLKAGAYTTLEPVAPYVTTFKANLLHSGKINLAKGPVATVEIHQLGNKIALFQGITDQQVPDCEYSCEVPTGVPLYFVEKPSEEKELCRPTFQLVVENERDKNLGCYDKKAIEEMLTKQSGCRSRVLPRFRRRLRCSSCSRSGRYQHSSAADQNCSASCKQREIFHCEISERKSALQLEQREERNRYSSRKRRNYRIF